MADIALSSGWQEETINTPIAYIDPLQPYQSTNVETTVQIYEMATKPQHRPLHDKNVMFVI